MKRLALFAIVFVLSLDSTALLGQEATHRVELPPVCEVGKGGVERAALIYPLENRPTPECHASTIVEVPEGLVAAWFGGKHEKNPDVGIWSSRSSDGGATWSRPELVVDGSENEDQDFACWNPVLFKPKNGPLMLFYKVGLNPRLWWGAVVTSSDGGKTWSNSRRLGTSDKLFAANQNLIGPVKNKPIQLSDGTILCASSTENEGWRVHFERSKDMGKTWEVTGPLQEGKKLDAIQPSILLHDSQGRRMQIVCRTQQSVLGTSWSEDGGETWGPMMTTSLPNPNSGTDAITLQDGRHLLVYNHSVREKGKNGRQILNVAVSKDGVDWQPKLTLESVDGRAEFSYPAVIQTRDGNVHITYTWQRKSVKHVVLTPEAF